MRADQAENLLHANYCCWTTLPKPSEAGDPMNEKAMKIKQPKRRGEWVELRFMAAAAENDLNVTRPWGDSPSTTSLSSIRDASCASR